MAGTTLCVVDMQPGFWSSDSIIKEVIREIKLAKRRNDGIVFLEMRPDFHNKTHNVLIDTAKSGGYAKVTYAEKKYNDGSDEFVKAVNVSGWSKLKRVRVCGVNRNACVNDTIHGLVVSGLDIKIELAFKATAPGPKRWEETTRWEKEDFQILIDKGILTIK